MVVFYLTWIWRKKITQFMGVDDAVIFSSEFQAIASTIPAFSKHGDILICDKAVSFAIQNGIFLSRSTVKWFNHNDMQDLERVLQSLSAVFKRQKQRVFLVVEGLYANHGDILDLKQVLELKQKYPFRIMLDESLSLGVLGKKGRGITEHFGIPSSKVEIVCASLGNAIGSIGGFACGTTTMVNHMRLNCNGYVFSCSSPPFTSRASIESFTLLETGPEISKLQQNTKILHQTLKKLKIKDLQTPSADISPYVHFRLPKSKSTGKRLSDECLLQEIVDEVFERGKIVLARSKYTTREAFPPEPSIKMSISALHTEAEVIAALECLSSVAAEKLSGK